MRQEWMRAGRHVATALALIGCGGGGDGDPVTPQPPTPVATIEVTPAAATLLVGETSQLTATMRDAGGGVITGRTPTWSSSSQGIATVSASGLVTAVGPGQAQIDATAEGKSGSATITVALATFQPANSTTLAGTQRFARVSIPSGVTVTASAALTLEAQDSLIVRGVVRGDCVPLTLIGGAVVIEGDVRNDCATDPPTDEPPPLRIISGSAMELGAGVTESSGDIIVTNDTTLTDADFPIAPRLAQHAFAQAAVIRGNCRTSGRTWRFRQRQQAASGQFGSNGRPGRTFRMDCAGDLILANGAVIEAQHGANGGDGEHNSTVAALAGGGNGGRGGEVRLRATGSIVLFGTDNMIRTGDGGDGGHATATGQPDPGPARAASATATGGNGGPPGLATLLAGGSIVPLAGGAALTIAVGEAGWGGEAIATGRNGLHAAERTGGAQAGGNATARGGRGGDSPDKKLVASGSVTAFVGVQGGHGGRGGRATAVAGNGGDGNEGSPPGADGGRIEAVGGTGGNSLVRDLLGLLVGEGGRGGSAVLRNGLGGHGWSDCVPGNKKPGGPGGAGGTGVARRGAPGTGVQEGQTGLVTAVGVGRGGAGGKGQGPGAGGAAGADSVQRPADVTDSFVPGAPGMPCDPISLAVIAGFYRLNATLQSITGSACPPGFFPPTINNPGPIPVTVEAPFAPLAPLVLGRVRIQSSVPVVGNLNDDGTYSGSGSGPVGVNGSTRSLVETISGLWEEGPGGLIELRNAMIRFQMFGGGGNCDARYSGTYTKLP